MIQKKQKIAIVISHPIQHFCPQYVSFAQNKDVDCKIFFASALGYKRYTDENFNKEISWGNLNLDKFNHFFLNGDAVIQADKNLDAPNIELELATFKPHLVFTYGYFQKVQRRTCRWALRNKVPLAYISDSELRHERNALKDFFKSIYLKRYFSKIDYFLTMGNANEAYYKEHGVPLRKMIRMHYPIDIEAYQKSYAEKELRRNQIRKEYNIPGDTIVLSVVGKLVTWKNQDHIIEAMKILEDKDINVQLFMLGSGNMMDAWKEKSGILKKSKVHFTGFVNIEKLPSFYAATDIYVHPASLEPHSVAISEAIFMGCPVVLSDRCGSYGETDDVQEGKNGFVYEFGNITELAAKIKTLAVDEEIRKSFGNYSHSIASAFQQRSHFGMLKQLSKRIEGQIEK
jgi:glycosyltransferase involved in cell wall biosynthesis